MGVFRVALAAALLWREFRRWERGPEPKKSDRGGSTEPARDVARYSGGSAYDTGLDAELDAAAYAREAELQDLLDRETEREAELQELDREAEREAELQNLLDREAELQTALDAVDAELDAADPDLVATARAELAAPEDEDDW